MSGTSMVQPATHRLSWAEVTGRGELIPGVGKTLNTIFSGQHLRERPPNYPAAWFLKLGTNTGLDITRSTSVCSELIFCNPGVLVAQKSCTWRGWFVLKPEPGFSPWSCCSGGTDGESLVGQESLVLCHPTAQPLCFYPKTSNLVFLKAFSDDMCTWHLFAMYICH